jgi:bloom syndrome protein
MEQIAKDKDDGTTPLTEEDKTRLTEEVKKVMEYCTNISRCRRVQVLRYFNEAFHESDCHKGCDVCMDDAEVTTRDVTPEAVEAIRLLKSMSGNNSMAHCKAVFVGSKKKEVMQRGHDGLPGHGKGHALGQKGIDQLFEELVAMDVFREQAITNSGGWSNSYLQVSDRTLELSLTDGCRLCFREFFFSAWTESERGAEWAEKGDDTCQGWSCLSWSIQEDYEKDGIEAGGSYRF